MSKFLMMILVVLVLAVGLVSCDSKDETPEEPNPCESGHTWLIEKETPAKCYAEGSRVLVCEVCSESQTLVLPKAAHVETPIVEKAATCTKPGNKAGSKCLTPGCNYKTGGESIPVLGHVAVDTPAKEPTCTELGYSTGGQHCATCSEVLKAPDETYPTIGHNYVDAGYHAPTCAAEGYLGGTRCDSCGKVGDAPIETYDKLEEHSAELVIISYATCTTDGYKECPVCHAQEVWEQKNKDLHAFNNLIEPAVAASCVTKTNGKTAIYQCSNPGCEVKVGGLEISWETLHGEDLKWETVIEATKDNAGEKIATCPVCNETFRMDIPPITDGDFNDDNNIYDDDIVGGKKEEDGE